MRHTWPPEGSELEAKMHEAAIGYAALLGATFRCGTLESPTWTSLPWQYKREDRYNAWSTFYQTQGEAAVGYLSYVRGYWLAYSDVTDEWELVRI